MYSIAIFGGAFDPIHNGHLHTSLTIQKHFNFDSYIFLPCKTPTIKPATVANSKQRIEMILRAIKRYKQNFKLDLREIERTTPSYMVETLESFRAEFPEASITLIIGYDAFLSLYQWHQWQKIITLAHLMVINRSEFTTQPIPEIMQQFLKKYQNENKQELLNTQSGSVFLFDAGNFEISSTSLRKEIKKGVNVKNKLPYSVYEYIKHQGLYQ
ncbi:nicotinate-nucleotide adenylyltransferase [Legionella cincinnatiensis]|uniref:Probable nicotinate-nucleotide adenylyltransferase n=1 Tax=Legionella cincinnatiensis TaxID=28085 RepID=A0A378IHS7_9GAMM|nr:nicotinate-nucleotide adenylyltransferase [Legionella cincinnatiensis]KTC81775.1 nicotinate-nucleotide adenylyltransferase NadD [Legionella cincinnatiensis]STX34583.1 nicotinate-nucleotide adenylyltransferase NadD [Legionella cincinnatiensis]